MSLQEQRYKQQKDFHESQQKQMFQLLSVGNDYDPLIMNVVIYCFGKYVCTLETHTLPHLQLAIERYIDQLPLKPEEMYNYITPKRIEEHVLSTNNTKMGEQETALYSHPSAKAEKE